MKQEPRFAAVIYSNTNNLELLKLQDNHTGTTSTSVRKVTLKVTCSLCWIAGGEWWSTLEKLECLNSVIMGGSPGYNAVLQCIYRISSTVLAMCLSKCPKNGHHRRSPTFTRVPLKLADVDLRRSDVTSTGDLHF